VTTSGTDGSKDTSYPNGKIENTLYGPDPRFGMQVPIIKANLSPAEVSLQLLPDPHRCSIESAEPYEFN